MREKPKCFGKKGVDVGLGLLCSYCPIKISCEKAKS